MTETNPDKQTDTDQIREELSRLVDSINQLLENQKSELADRGRDKLEAVEERVKANPIKALGIALLAGYIGGLFLSRKH